MARRLASKAARSSARLGVSTRASGSPGWAAGGSAMPRMTSWDIGMAPFFVRTFNNQAADDCGRCVGKSGRAACRRYRHEHAARHNQSAPVHNQTASLPQVNHSPAAIGGRGQHDRISSQQTPRACLFIRPDKRGFSASGHGARRKDIKERTARATEMTQGPCADMPPSGSAPGAARHAGIVLAGGVATARHTDSEHTEPEKLA